jgi:hypothetical protein
MKKANRNQIEALVKNWDPSEIDGAIELLESIVWKMRTVYVEVADPKTKRVERIMSQAVYMYRPVLEEITPIGSEVYSFSGKSSIKDAQAFMARINKAGGSADPIVDYGQGPDVPAPETIGGVVQAMSQAELEKFFDLVKNTNDWRAPIDAVIAMGKFEKCRAAVWHFTATELKIVTPSKASKVRVQATGYRNGPAGP